MMTKYTPWQSYRTVVPYDECGNDTGYLTDNYRIITVRVYEYCTCSDYGRQVPTRSCPTTVLVGPAGNLVLVPIRWISSLFCNHLLYKFRDRKTAPCPCLAHHLTSLLHLWLRSCVTVLLYRSIGDQLRLLLPISGGRSSNLPTRVLCPSIVPIHRLGTSVYCTYRWGPSVYCMYP